MEAQTKPTVESVAQVLLDRFGPHVAALMAYGSRVFGQARVGSAFDYWLIVRDLERFHHENAEFYRTQTNVASTPEQQVALNRLGPIFYSLRQDGVEIKFAVLDEDTLLRLCRSEWWTVKGRMQKPLQVIRSSPKVEEAILAARCEGLTSGLNLVPRQFSMEELLYQIVSLSYRAEIRPERKGPKIQSILNAGRPQLEAIYRPLLADLAYVEARDGGFVDRRSEEDRVQARRATLEALRHSKWCKQSMKFIWRNFCSHPKPLRYMMMKVVGEVQKPIAKRLKKTPPRRDGRER